MNPVVVDARKEGFGLVDDHYHRQAWDLDELRQCISMEIVALVEDNNQRSVDSFAESSPQLVFGGSGCGVTAECFEDTTGDPSRRFPE